VRSRNHCCRGKGISIKYSERYVSRLRCTISSNVASLALPYFLTFSHKRRDLRGGGRRGGITEHKTCVLIFCTILHETVLILTRIQRHITINVHRYSCKVPVIIVIYSCNLYFRYRFSRNSQMSNFMGIRPWELSCSMRAERRTDRHEANSRFSQFCEHAYINTAPKD
jgi:hypothetical protein